MNNARLGVMALGLGAFLIPGVSSLSAAETPAARIAQAADALVRTLNAAQRQGVQFALDDAQQRTRWSNLPVSMAKHGGLRMGDLTEEQRAAAMKLLRATLSERGYEKVVGIVQSDEVLRRQGNSTVPFGQDEYFISFMGKPSPTEPWMLQFGGHHLALNITLAGERGVLTPSLIAVQLAKFEWNGKTVRPMGPVKGSVLTMDNKGGSEQTRKAGGKMGCLCRGRYGSSTRERFITS